MTPFRRTALAVAGLLVASIAVFGTTARSDAGPYVVFDASTGVVIDERDAFVPWYPASLTKLMTAYVTFEALRSGEITLDSAVVMTPEAAREPPSKMGFKPGTAITVDTALKILIVKSANDVAMALAQSVGGSEAAFVDRMNATAARLGMVGTRFANPNGLPDDSQWTTARDFALLSRAILVEYPEYRGLFRITALQLGSKLIRTHNHLLERYPGTDGMKTGFICASGFNVVQSVTRGRRTLVAVVMGERTAMDRAVNTANLIEAGFDSSGGFFSKKVTLAALRPDVRPPSTPANIRDQVCGKNRAKGEDADADVGSGGEAKNLLVPRFELMPPVQISLGVPKAIEATKAAMEVPSAVLPRPNPLRADAIGDLIPELADGSGPPIQILGIKGTDN